MVYIPRRDQKNNVPDGGYGFNIRLNLILVIPHMQMKDREGLP